MTESDILETALESLEKITQAKTSVTKKVPKSSFEWDALLNIKIGNIKEKFNVEIKRNLPLARIVDLIDQMKAKNGLLVAQTIPKPSQEVMKQLGINYLDIAGNCFIRTESGLFWQISGNKVPSTLRQFKDKAFSKNGIKLVFALLVEPKMIYAPYRTWANFANISVGTVGDILKDLRAQQYIIRQNEKKVKLQKEKELLTRWVTAYTERLKPKLFRGNFRFVKESKDWKNLSLPEFSYWGGEPAAELWTNNLYPAKWTLYSDMPRSYLIKSGFIPDQDGSVEVYSPFWEEIFVSGHKEKLNPSLSEGIVHPLIAYADLVGSKNNRNIETAKKIYEQYLQNIFE